MLLTRTAAQIPLLEQEIPQNDQSLQVAPGPSHFKCLFIDCLEIFASSAQLESHIQEEHSDMETMNPDGSDEEFVINSQLEESVPRHVCPFLSCREKFTFKDDLLRHTEEKHPRKDKGPGKRSRHKSIPGNIDSNVSGSIDSNVPGIIDSSGEIPSMQRDNQVVLPAENSNQALMQFSQHMPSSELEDPIWGVLRRHQTLQLASFNMIGKHLESKNEKK